MMRSRILLAVTMVTALFRVASADGMEDTPAPQVDPEPVEIAKSYRVPSKILGQTRRINVYLPPSYLQGNESYPALYLLDGGIKEDFLHIVGIASLAAEFRNIREFIVIGIEGIDRYHDLIHPSAIEITIERLRTSGGSAKFRRFLAEELEPFVRASFRLTDETVLMGESAAGMFVLETFLRRPKLFNGYISVSPMLWWNDQSLAKESAALLQDPRRFRLSPSNGDSRPIRRLYLTIADEGGTMREGVDIVVKALQEHKPDDVRWSFAPMEEETHGTIFHPAALLAIREFFAIR